MAIDKKHILENISNLGIEMLGTDVDTNLVSTAGHLNMTMAASIDDTLAYARWKAANSIPELSNDETMMRTVAKIRDISFDKAIPGVSAFMLILKISDILDRGKSVNVNEKQVIIDRRSAILSNGISFAILNDISIRATKLNGKDIISANYQNADKVNEFIHTQYFTDEEGSPAFSLLLSCEQINYNIAQKTVNDIIQFTYDGIPFDYNNLLGGFEVQYRKTPTDAFKTVTPVYFELGATSASEILYNDDQDGVVYILNNPLIGLDESSEIKVTIKETLAKAGEFTVGNSESSFSMYKDETEDFSGISVRAVMVRDCVGASNPSTRAELKDAMIRGKYGPATITDRDLMSALGTMAPDTYMCKKRNDMYDRLWNLYTVIRDSETNPMPLTTLKLNLKMSDFEINHLVTKRKVLKCNNMFTLHPTEPDTLVKVVQDPLNPIDIAAYENDSTKLLLNLPFTIMVDSNHVLTYFYTTLDQDVHLKYKTVYEFPYQFLTNNVNFSRNSIAKTGDDLYHVTVSAILNTPDNIGILNEQGQIIGADMVKCIMRFYDETGKAVSYMFINLEAFDPASKRYSFKGTFKTSDYITADRKIEIIDGMKAIMTPNAFLDVLPYTDLKFDLIYMYKQTPTSQNDLLYSDVPGLGQYSICSIYSPETACTLATELNRFMRSPVILLDDGNSSINYLVNEVPLVKYSYSLANYSLFYKRMITVKDSYLNLITRLADFEVNLKFSRTYGKSHYIKIGDADLNNLTPHYKFKIYGKDVDVVGIKKFIKDYFNGFESTNTKIFITNLVTAIENKFQIKSCQYLGVDTFDSTYQLLSYQTPDLNNKAALKSFVPEYMSPGEITLIVVDSF